jgi:anti-anti-sigma factor
MKISISQHQGRVPVTILRPEGDIDGSNFSDLIGKAREARDAGAKDILIDLSDVPFMSSAGLAALQSIAAMLRDERNSDGEWDVFAALDIKRDQGLHPHLKLLNPQPGVDHLLEMIGFKRFLETFNHLDTALASF